MAHVDMTINPLLPSNGVDRFPSLNHNDALINIIGNMDSGHEVEVHILGGGPALTGNTTYATGTPGSHLILTFENPPPQAYRNLNLFLHGGDPSGLTPYSHFATGV